MKELFKEIFEAVMANDKQKLARLKPKAREVLKPFRPKPDDVFKVPIKAARLHKWAQGLYDPVSDTIFVKIEYVDDINMLAKIVKHELTHRNIWVTNSDKNTIYMLSIILEFADHDLDTFMTGYAPYYITRQANKIEELIFKVR